MESADVVLCRSCREGRRSAQRGAITVPLLQVRKRWASRAVWAGHLTDPTLRSDPRDSIFTAQLFVSDTEDLYRCVAASHLLYRCQLTSARRYTDDGDATALCRWTVDLAALPRFHFIAQSGGGYVEFDLGLSLDSAEVKGELPTLPVAAFRRAEVDPMSSGPALIDPLL